MHNKKTKTIVINSKFEKMTKIARLIIAVGRHQKKMRITDASIRNSNKSHSDAGKAN